YMTTKEAGLKWSISDRRIRILCTEGKIEGAVKIGRNWSVPSDAMKPIDNRTKMKSRFQGTNYQFDAIDEQKKAIDLRRPLTKNQYNTLRNNLIVEWTYNSNAIEGNTLTLSETKVVLEGITIGGKSVVEHLEAINHRDAILFLESIVDRQEEISEWNIRNLHQIILKDIDNLNAGKYRMENVLISGAKHIPPDYLMVPVQMQKLVYEDNREWIHYHPVVRAALLHGEFVKIHPFIDGNGRTARLLLNLVLMSNGYPPIVIKKESRLAYYEALDTAHTTLNYSKFVHLIATLVFEAEQLWLKILK
ncbi:MAG: Fic family protein, partial [Candidatus Izemoplasmatales bacterium]|nr:Fic family protein [Candidatus Izemoplasmatales bacterium]